MRFNDHTKYPKITYDTSGRVTSIEYYDAECEICKHEFVYDSNGNIIEDRNAERVLKYEYTYDEQNRVIQVIRYMDTVKNFIKNYTRRIEKYEYQDDIITKLFIDVPDYDITVLCLFDNKGRLLLDKQINMDTVYISEYKYDDNNLSITKTWIIGEYNRHTDSIESFEENETYTSKFDDYDYYDRYAKHLIETHVKYFNDEDPFSW